MDTLKRRRKKMLYILIILLFYIIFKIFVLNTQTKKDDQLPDIAFKMLTIEDETEY